MDYLNVKILIVIMNMMEVMGLEDFVLNNVKDIMLLK
jgi:hypothetical protein